MNSSNRVPLYVLNNFMKFERKLYQVFGLQLGRPLRLKAVGYFIFFGLLEILIYFTPVIGNVIRWIPFGVLILIPIGLAWLLADVGTEGRSPTSFFKSFILYQIRKLKGDSYYREKNTKKEGIYQFRNYITLKTTNIQGQDRKEFQRVLEDRERALRYMRRIHDPDTFFRELKENREENKKENHKLRRFFAVKKGA